MKRVKHEQHRFGISLSQSLPRSGFAPSKPIGASLKLGLSISHIMSKAHIAQCQYYKIENVLLWSSRNQRKLAYSPENLPFILAPSNGALLVKWFKDQTRCFGDIWGKKKKKKKGKARVLRVFACAFKYY